MRRRSADFRQYHKRCTRFTQTLHKGAPFFAEPQRGGFAVCGRRERRGARRGGMTPYPRRGGRRRTHGGGTTPYPRRGATPYPRRGAKRKDNLRFSFLFGLLPFPCFLIWRRLPTCDRSEIGYGRGFFLPCLSQPVRSIRYRSATQTVKFPQARHSSAAQFVSAL